MNKEFKNFIPFLKAIVVAIVLAIIIDLVFYLNLPSEHKYETKVIKETTVTKIKKVEQKKLIKEKPNFLLNALFKASQNSFAIVSKGSDSITLNLGDKIDGFVLLSVFDDYAVFSKNNHEYKLYLSNKKDEKTSIDNSKTSSYNTTLSKVFNKPIDLDIMIEKNEDSIKVDKILVDGYVSNYKQIWKEVAINEMYDGNNISGFKVSAIAKGSTFDRIGLQKGDTIKSVNGQEVNSYADAFKLYFKMKNTKTINIGIIRDNKNMELNYEIE